MTFQFTCIKSLADEIHCDRSRDHGEVRNSLVRCLWSVFASVCERKCIRLVKAVLGKGTFKVWENVETWSFSFIELVNTLVMLVQSLRKSIFLLSVVCFLLFCELLPGWTNPTLTWC